MYFTDRGIEELADRRGEEEVSLGWLAERLRDFVDRSPEFETAIDRLASWLARLDDDGEDLLFRTGRGSTSGHHDYCPSSRCTASVTARARLIVSLPPGSAGETGIWQALRARTV